MTCTFTTADGGTVDVTRRGIEVDMHLRDPAGRTVATVVLPADDASALVDELANA
ncbi:hypothetical protein AB0M39_33485 [Streptomyces sp. NPDC051907]|uniref:hypothetical protein n=1 Tax=unclassified Streptomyces TaxID=2593676 RepID=UPI001BE9F60D|nr:hypothetical protein [Streptomyces sp. ISL-100]MBT2401294.1 hypothetical protein [Streptomyces sp. ISL-100]